MKIAPIDIAHKQFSKKMMGLDPNEVHGFLQQVAEELENMIRDRNNLREALREKELQIHEYRERDKALRDTISTAQKMSEKIAEEAQREARLILMDANQQGDTIIRDARDSLKRIYQEISDLKKLKIQFDSNMRSILQAHLGLLDNQEQYIATPMLNKPSIPDASV
jgi:cell division initiation protein